MDASADKARIALLQQQLAESKEDLTRLEHKLDAAERLKDTLNLEVSQLKAALNHAHSTSEQTSISQVEYEGSSISKLPQLKRKLQVRFFPPE
jgi:regulator of replication initiation timing